jgi:glycosyltransferase involved in cell wall biosynthesis
VIQVVMLGDSLVHKGGIVTVEKLILQYVPPTVAIHHIATHEEGSVAHRLRVFSLGLARLIGRLLTQPVDLVHIHLADWGSVPRKVIVAIVALLFRKPVVLHAHGPEFHLTYKALPSWARQLLIGTFQRCRLIALSQSWQQFYTTELELAEAQVSVLPNPIELPPLSPEPTAEPTAEPTVPLTILFLGKIGLRKGAFDLIHAFAQLPAAQQQTAQLWLAGDGELEAAAALIAQLGLGERVKLWGWIDAAQRNLLLQQADIFTLPSHNEALPMSLLEAMAWGLPVVSCPVGGITDFVRSGQNGLLVPPGQIPQLTAALQSLITAAPLRQTLGQAARQTVAQLDVKQYVVQLEALYRDCINNCSR